MDYARLDKSVFTRSISCLALRVKNSHISHYARLFHGHLLSMPRIRFIQPISTTDTATPATTTTSASTIRDKYQEEKRILFDTRYTQLTDLPTHIQHVITTSPHLLDTLHHFQITLTYDHLSMHDIFTACLPPSIDFGSSFETIGHIAHLNLADHVLPYKYLIAQVILDKNPSLQTVVCKRGTIQSEFRTFDMEVLAGPNQFETRVRENDCVFDLDFARVYFNTRLHMQHERVVFKYLRQPRVLAQVLGSSKPQKQLVVADLTAGIGPFVIPALRLYPRPSSSPQSKALSNQQQQQQRDDLLDGTDAYTAYDPKKKRLGQPVAFAFANDLNPDSTRYLRLNAQTNHVQDRMEVSTLDSTTFIHQVIPKCFRKFSGEGNGSGDDERRFISQFVMNLPALGLDLMSGFRGAYISLLEFKLTPNDVSMPLIHTHCFTRNLMRPRLDIVVRLMRALGLPVPTDLEERYQRANVMISSDSTPTTTASSGANENENADKDVSEEEQDLSEDVPKWIHDIQFVRKVAPSKDMYCVSFVLPRQVAFESSQSASAGRSSDACSGGQSGESSDLASVKKRPKLTDEVEGR